MHSPLSKPVRLLAFAAVVIAAVATIAWMSSDRKTPYLLSSLNLEDAAVRTVGHPDSKRVLYSFASVDCTYCRQIHPELQRLNNVRIYTFILPGHSEDANEVARAAWCAIDREVAWNRAMQGERPAPAPTCTEAVGVDRNRATAMAIGLTVTPTLLRADGRALVGYQTAAEIERWIDELSVTPAI